jgi:hypothetical protein
MGKFYWPILFANVQHGEWRPGLKPKCVFQRHPNIEGQILWSGGGKRRRRRRQTGGGETLIGEGAATAAAAECQLPEEGQTRTLLMMRRRHQQQQEEEEGMSTLAQQQQQQVNLGKCQIPRISALSIEVISISIIFPVCRDGYEMDMDMEMDGVVIDGGGGESGKRTTRMQKPQHQISQCIHGKWHPPLRECKPSQLQNPLSFTSFNSFVLINEFCRRLCPSRPSPCPLLAH